MAQSGSALSCLLFVAVAILSLDPARSQTTTIPGIVLTPDIATIVINNELAGDFRVKLLLAYIPLHFSVV